MNMVAEYERCKELIDKELENLFTEKCSQQILLESMRYSLLAGGKRIRPILVLKFCEAAGGNVLKALPFACAVELIHTYSLIHDDLPCMDDDNLRRGKPTNHVMFGECTATLAGDALQAAAFDLMLNHDVICSLGGSKPSVRSAHILALAAGYKGMVGGQILDMQAEGRADLNEKELIEIYNKKTGALIEAACVIGVLVSAQEPERKYVEAAKKYASHLGLAFQIRDDVLDITADEDVLGKTVGSDASNEKATFATIFGIDECERLIKEHTSQAKEVLNNAFQSAEFLEWLADMLAYRKK